MSKTIVDALNNYCEKLTGTKPQTRTIRGALNAITEANGGTPSRGGIADAIDCLCECSGGGEQNVVFANGLTTFAFTQNTVCANITELSIPEGITTLTCGDCELAKCFPNLVKLTLPSTLTSLDGVQFNYPPPLEECNIPGGVKKIPDYFMLEGDGVKKLNIEEGVEELGKSVISYAYGITVYIPSTVTTIDTQAFEGCTGTIVVNKPENSISGAPWGAGNATVVWTG